VVYLKLKTVEVEEVEVAVEEAELLLLLLLYPKVEVRGEEEVDCWIDQQLEEESVQGVVQSQKKPNHYYPFLYPMHHS
jgi:hypothetical protein